MEEVAFGFAYASKHTSTRIRPVKRHTRQLRSVVKHRIPIAECSYPKKPRREKIDVVGYGEPDTSWKERNKIVTIKENRARTKQKLMQQVKAKFWALFRT